MGDSIAKLLIRELTPAPVSLGSLHMIHIAPNLFICSLTHPPSNKTYYQDDGCLEVETPRVVQLCLHCGNRTNTSGDYSTHRMHQLVSTAIPTIIRSDRPPADVA